MKKPFLFFFALFALMAWTRAASAQSTTPILDDKSDPIVLSDDGVQ